MKQLQWIGAAAALVALVFFVTFIMNYLGGAVSPKQVDSGQTTKEIEVTFLSPTQSPYAVECEVNQTRGQDYWFRNQNDKPVTFGLVRVGCRCSAVEASLVPASQPIESLASAVGFGLQGPIAVFSAHVLALGVMQKDATNTELLHGTGSVSIPAQASGWVRLRWKGEKLGPQRLSATIWNENRNTGKTFTLEALAIFHEPIRVRDHLSLGLLTDNDLTKGVTR
jgi:hypothetical protein